MYIIVMRSTDEEKKLAALPIYQQDTWEHDQVPAMERARLQEEFGKYFQSDDQFDFFCRLPLDMKSKRKFIDLMLKNQLNKK